MAAINAVTVGEKYFIKMIVLLLLLLWNSYETAHGTQGKKTPFGDKSYFLTVLVVVVKILKEDGGFSSFIGTFKKMYSSNRP